MILPGGAKPVHIGRAEKQGLDKEAVNRGAVAAFVEHGLLQAADALVRSRSGFSMTAAQMGFSKRVFAGFARCRRV